jgi:hypothetical protein
MVPDYPEPASFVVPTNRGLVTLEESQSGDWDPRFGDHDWLRLSDQGGGFVPPTLTWRSSPKQDQDDLGCK